MGRLGRALGARQAAAATPSCTTKRSVCAARPGSVRPPAPDPQDIVGLLSRRGVAVTHREVGTSGVVTSLLRALPHCWREMYSPGVQSGTAGGHAWTIPYGYIPSMPTRSISLPVRRGGYSYGRKGDEGATSVGHAWMGKADDRTEAAAACKQCVMRLIGDACVVTA